jgi:hypothetical protein
VYRRLIAAGASPQEALYLASRPSLCQKISSGKVDAIEGLALQRIAMRAKMPAEIAVKGSAAQQHYRELLALGYTEQKALDEIKAQGQAAPETTATPPPPKVKAALKTQSAVEPPQVIATAKVEANETLDPTSDNPTFKATEGPQQATITTISHKDFQAILKKIDNKLV